MNPWSSAEAGDESLERELFARRARALAPAVVPSLASVLRAAEATREAREIRRARGRASVAVILAAACMMAALTRLPRTETRGERGETGESIAADIDASAGYPVSQSIAQDVPAEPVCSIDDEIVASEEPACFASAPLFTPAPAFTRPQISRACDSNESCATMTP